MNDYKILQDHLKSISQSVTAELDCKYKGQFTAIRIGDAYHIRVNVIGPTPHTVIIHMSDPEFFDKIRAELIKIFSGEYGECSHWETLR